MSHRRHGRKDRRPVLWLGDSPGGNYTEKVVRLGEQLTEKYGPSVSHIMILHDDDCALIARGRVCNCAPDVVLQSFDAVGRAGGAA